MTQDENKMQQRRWVLAGRFPDSILIGLTGTFEIVDGTNCSRFPIPGTAVDLDLLRSTRNGESIYTLTTHLPVTADYQLPFALGNGWEEVTGNPRYDDAEIARNEWRSLESG